MTVDEAIVQAARVGALDTVTAFRFTRSTDKGERRRCAKAVADWLAVEGDKHQQLVSVLRKYAGA